MPESEQQQNNSFPSDTHGLTGDQRIDLVEKQILILHYQFRRFASEMESEKGTRARVNADMAIGIKEIEKRVRLLEKAWWSGIGILIFVEFLFRAKLFPSP